MHEISTYAQVVGKAIVVESTGNEITKECARERSAQVVIPPFVGLGRGRDPSD